MKILFPRAMRVLTSQKESADSFGYCLSLLEGCTICMDSLVVTNVYESENTQNNNGSTVELFHLRVRCIRGGALRAWATVGRLAPASTYLNLRINA
jgi:hypothetical protein